MSRRARTGALRWPSVQRLRAGPSDVTLPRCRDFKPRYDAFVAVVCDGLLVESTEGFGECDQGDACQALALRGDYAAYRAAHGRVIADGQAENKDEYGGEA